MACELERKTGPEEEKEQKEKEAEVNRWERKKKQIEKWQDQEKFPGMHEQSTTQRENKRTGRKNLEREDERRELRSDDGMPRKKNRLYAAERTTEEYC